MNPELIGPALVILVLLLGMGAVFMIERSSKRAQLRRMANDVAERRAINEQEIARAQAH